jgi:hypothetical protein
LQTTSLLAFLQLPCKRLKLRSNHHCLTAVVGDSFYLRRGRRWSFRSTLTDTSRACVASFFLATHRVQSHRLSKLVHRCSSHRNVQNSIITDNIICSDRKKLAIPVCGAICHLYRFDAVCLYIRKLNSPCRGKASNCPLFLENAKGLSPCPSPPKADSMFGLLTKLTCQLGSPFRRLCPGFLFNGR